MDQESDFVFLYDEGVEKRSNLTEYIKTFCEASEERERLASIALLTSSRPMDVNPKDKGSSQPTRMDFVKMFRFFLLSHVQLALGTGFDDNAHRVADDRKYAFILPKLGDWMSAFNTLKKVLLTEEQEYSHHKVRIVSCALELNYFCILVLFQN